VGFNGIMRPLKGGVCAGWRCAVEQGAHDCAGLPIETASLCEGRWLEDVEVGLAEWGDIYLVGWRGVDSAAASSSTAAA